MAKVEVEVIELKGVKLTLDTEIGTAIHISTYSGITINLEGLKILRSILDSLNEMAQKLDVREEKAANE